MNMSAKKSHDKNRGQRRGTATWRRLASAALCALLLVTTMTGAFAADDPIMAPATPVETNLPTTPDMPTTPDTPPVTSGTPDTPPVTSGTPDTPPVTSGTPDTPTTPTTPTTPDINAPSEKDETLITEEPEEPEEPDNALVHPTQYTVTFHLNGGTVDGNTADVSVPVNEGDLAPAAPIPDKEGFVFSGWYLLDASGNMIEPEIAYDPAAPVTADMDYAAKWTEAAPAEPGDSEGENEGESATVTIYYVTRELSEADRDKSFEEVFIANGEIVESGGEKFYLLKAVTSADPDNELPPDGYVEEVPYARMFARAAAPAADSEAETDTAPAPTARIVYLSPAADPLPEYIKTYVLAGTETPPRPRVTVSIDNNIIVDNAKTKKTPTEDEVNALSEKGYYIVNKTGNKYGPAAGSYKCVDAAGNPMELSQVTGTDITYLVMPIDYTITYKSKEMGLSAEAQRLFDNAVSAVTAPPNTRPAAAASIGRNPTIYTTVDSDINIKNPAGLYAGDKFYKFDGWTDAAASSSASASTAFKISTGSTDNKVLQANWSEGSDAGTGTLTVSMSISGAVSEADKATKFHFTLTLAGQFTGDLSGLKFTNGVSESFELGNGEHKEITGLPVGVGYTVTEAEANRNGFTTNVTMSDSQGVYGRGTIAAGSNTVSFDNHKYKPTQLAINAVKTLNGRAPGNYQFWFLLQQGNTLVDRKLNNNLGRVSFDPLTFTNPGTYVYTVSEYQDGRTGIRWDTHTYTVTVVVAITDSSAATNELSLTVSYKRDGVAYASNDNNVLQFKNYTTLPPGYVRTGDDANPALWAAAMALSVAVIVGIVVVNRRKKKNNAADNAGTPAEKSPEATPEKPEDNSDK